MCGVWLDIQIVYSSVPGLYQPMSPRTSIGFGIRRWLTIRWRTTTSAPSMAASVPGLVADGPVEDDVVRGVLVELRRAGLRSPSRRRRRPAAAPSRRRSPRARRSACAARLGDDRGDALAGPLDAVGREDARRVDVVLDARRCRRPARPSAAGCTGCRRRRRRRRRRASPWRRVVSIERMLACAYGLRRMAMWVIDWQLDVVEVAALAGDEARVLDPLDAVRRGRRGVIGRSSRLRALRGDGAAARSRIVAAASRIAATMFW